jgi:hypothetical protein
MLVLKELRLANEGQVTTQTTLYVGCPPVAWLAARPPVVAVTTVVATTASPAAVVALATSARITVVAVVVISTAAIAAPLYSLAPGFASTLRVANSHKGAPNAPADMACPRCPWHLPAGTHRLRAG